MTWTTIAAIYFVMWWIVLFAILPWGVRSQHEHGDVVPGSDPGAPTVPKLRQKVVWTTVVTTVLFAISYYGYSKRWFSLEGITAYFGMPF
jgi:predicted secreted protein